MTFKITNTRPDDVFKFFLEILQMLLKKMDPYFILRIFEIFIPYFFSYYF